MSEERSIASYLRRGARTALTGQGRADLDLVLAADGVEQRVQVRGLQLAGPEHARGIAPGALRKHFPAAGSTDMRAGGLPYVEWHDPALPWALTPTAPAQGRLSPFIALLCVPEGTGGTDWLQAGTMPVPRAHVDVPDGLPDPAAYELMAHVEDPDPPGDPATAADTAAPSPRAFSRMLCPQRLAPRTRYVAMVVPLYESGRLAGLGEPVPDGGAAGFAWQAGAGSATLPVYLSWRFTTGAGRGVEDMLRDLHAVAPTGRTAELPVAKDATAALVPALRGADVTKRAVFPVQPPAPPQPEPDLGPAVDVSAARAAGRLPMPAYGRTFAAGAEPGAATAPGWYEGANLDPSLRVMAGHGASIVRRRQEEITAFVLDSAGQIEEANALLSRAHTAMFLTGRLHERLTAMGAPTSSWSRLLGPAAARTRQGRGSFAPWLAGSTDGMLLDPTLHRAMAGGGPLDPGRSRRGDPADAIRVAAAEAATAPTVPGAAPLGDAIRTLDDRTSRQTGAVDPGEDTVEEALDRALSDPRVLREDPELAEAHDARRARQDADRRRPDRARAPAHVPDRADLGASIRQALDPHTAVPPRIASRISGLQPDPLPRRTLTEPVWPEPVVSELFAVDPEALSPGLADLPDDGVMGLDLDAAAVDAVILGANTEVLRELRWRGVPHDPLTSPVRRAFSAPSGGGPLPPDTQPLRAWDPGRPLGGGRIGDLGLIVLIRSQLFREFPETVITLVEAAWDPETDRRELDPAHTHLPQVMGRLGEDVTYVGFTPDRRDMVGDPDPDTGRPGGFLVFQQPDGGLTFGLGDDVDDAAGPRTLDSWNALAWSDLSAPEIRADTLQATVGGPLIWGQNSATMAAILLERPVTLALHVSDIAGEST